jgi:hypothetical protein
MDLSSHKSFTEDMLIRTCLWFLVYVLKDLKLTNTLVLIGPGDRVQTSFIDEKFCSWKYFVFFPTILQYLYWSPFVLIWVLHWHASSQPPNPIHGVGICLPSCISQIWIKIDLHFCFYLKETLFNSAIYLKRKKMY